MQDKKFFKIIIFIVVLFIPIIYSFFYLKSYWNPYGNLDELKIAIVNLDNGLDGKNRGEELVKELKEKGIMNFIEIKEEEVNKQREECYAIITIPNNFTECLNSAGEEDKQIASIKYSPNQKKNYLASQIINKIIVAAEMQLQSTVSEEITNSLADKLKEVPDNLKEISNGADKIYDGTLSLNKGMNDLNSGIELLNNKYTEFNDGVKSAYDGSSSLNEGATQVDSGIDSLVVGSKNLNNAISQINAGVEVIDKVGNEKITELTTGIVALDVGMTDLKEGINKYVDSSNKLAGGISNYISGINQIKQNEEQILLALIQYSSVTPDENIKQIANKAQAILQISENSGINESSEILISGAKELINAGSSVKQGAEQVNNGTSMLRANSAEISNLVDRIGELKAGLTEVKVGTESLDAGVSKLKTGTEQVKFGAITLKNGLYTLRNSSDTVKNSLMQLEDGSKKAVNGSLDLLNGVGTFKSEIENGIETANKELGKLEGLGDFTYDSVKVEEEPYGEVMSYGIAFTPLFLSIGLWVGALMCYVVLYYDQRHRFGILDHNEKNKILQNILYLVIGVACGVVTGIVLKITLGFDIVNAFTYCFECGMVGLVFMAIMQFLIRNLGDIGKFLALIILVLQLASCGGTFPVETVDKAFRFLNPILPMTYSINAFKECLISTETSMLGNSNLVLISIGLILILATFSIEYVKIKKEEK